MLEHYVYKISKRGTLIHHGILVQVDHCRSRETNISKCEWPLFRIATNKAPAHLAFCHNVFIHSLVFKVSNTKPHTLTFWNPHDINISGTHKPCYVWHVMFDYLLMWFINGLDQFLNIFTDVPLSTTTLSRSASNTN